MDFVQIRAKVITDETGAIVEIPILLTDRGPLEPLTDYLLWRRYDRSVAWMRKVVQAVSPLLSYMKANTAYVDKQEQMFHTFAQRKPGIPPRFPVGCAKSHAVIAAE